MEQNHLDLLSLDVYFTESQTPRSARTSSSLPPRHGHLDVLDAGDLLRLFPLVDEHPRVRTTFPYLSAWPCIFNVRWI